MDALTRFFSRLQPNQYLQIAVLAVICLSFCNMMYSSLHYEFGWGPRTFLIGPEDRFADLVKLSLSFRTLTSGLEQTQSFEQWSPVYQFYYRIPCYGGRESLALGAITHFHHPPFAILLLMLCSLFIAKTGSPTLAIWLFFALYVGAVCWMICLGIPRERRTKTVIFAVVVLCFLAYPSLLILSRANYVNAGFTTIPIIVFLLSVFGRRNAGFLALLALALAVNIKPNAIIFVFALPLALGLRQAVKPLLRFLAIASAIFSISYASAHLLYPDYTLRTFLQGLRIYRVLYVAGPYGDGFNSSLLAFVKNMNTMFPDSILSFSAILWSFYALSAILIVGVCWGLWHARDRRVLAPFVLTSLYCLLSPVFGDYHLLVFLASVLLIFFDWGLWEGNYRTSVLIALVSIVLLSPKNYLFMKGLSLQTVINPGILYFATLYIVAGRTTGMTRSLPRTGKDASSNGEGAALGHAASN